MPFPSNNVSSFSGHGRYGYFNSHRTETIDPNTGETVIGYDRTYTNEDMNAFMRGIVNADGIFNRSGESVSITSTSAPQHTACGVKIDTTSEATYKLQSDEGEYPAGSYFAAVTPGKGLVNYHWFQIENGESIRIYFENDPDLNDRADKVSIRWVKEYRVIQVVVEKGRASADLKNGSPITTTAEVQAVGMVQNRSWTDNVGFQTKQIVVGGATLTVREITLGYMYIRGTKWQEQHPGQCPLWFRNCRGNKYCPWITHLVAGPSAQDLDDQIRQYTDVIEDWIADVTTGGDLGMKLSTLKIHITGSANNNVHNDFNLTSVARQRGYTDYTYNPDHTVMVYYNGLIMSIENDEYSLADNGDMIIKNGTGTGESDAGGVIPEHNMVDIVIFIGSTLAIPNGDFIRY
jgi:hypothetical protein